MMNHREVKGSESLRISTVATNVANRTSDKVPPTVRVAAVACGTAREHPPADRENGSIGRFPVELLKPSISQSN